MSQPIHIAMYSDVHCPYAYISAYRLRKLRQEYQGKIVIEHKSLALEYVNKRPTPKIILETETPVLLLDEPELPYSPWHRPVSEWPVTMWPAFEAIKCAERQSWELADDLDWAIRRAFFVEAQCISMRHVLFELAEKVGLDMQRFADDFNRGITKYQVLQEAKDGWERLKVEGSPTFVLPSGKQLSYLALPKIQMDPQQHYRIVSYKPAPCQGAATLDLYRQMFAEAAN